MGFDDKKFWGSDKLVANHSDRVESFLQGRKFYPIQVEFDLTNKCNHDCPGCSGWRTKYISPGATWETEKALNVLREMQSLGVKSCILSGGGEPTIHRDYALIVHEIKKMGFDVGSITDGEVLDALPYKQLLQDLTWLRISVDAATFSLHSKIHGVPMSRPDRYERIVKNVDLMAKTSRHLRMQGLNGATIGLGFLVGFNGTDNTEHEIVPFAQRFVPMKPDYIQYRPFQYTDQNVWFSDEALEKLKEAKKLETPETKIVFSDWRGDIKRSYDHCYGSHFITKVNSAGKMYVCCHWQNDSRFEVGDLNTHTFEQIWNSGKVEQLVERIDVHRCIPLCKYNRHNEMLATLKRDPGSLAELKQTKADYEHPNFI